MPDPLAWSVASAASFSAGAAAIWFLRRAVARRGSAAHGLALLAAFALAALLGWALLGIAPRLPPTNALDRFLLLVFPGALAVESLGAARSWSPRASGAIRVVLSPLLGLTILYGSVYLRPGSEERAAGLGAVGVTAGAVAWLVLSLLPTLRSVERRWQDASDAETATALSLAILTTGFATMLAGYLKGGAAALPLAGAMAATACAAYGRREAPDEPGIGAGVIRLGAASLVGLALIGRFFGNLATLDATLLCLAPLGALAPRLVAPRLARDWRGVLLGLLVAAMPLAVVVARAISTFQQKFQPLMR